MFPTAFFWGSCTVKLKMTCMAHRVLLERKTSRSGELQLVFRQNQCYGSINRTQQDEGMYEEPVMTENRRKEPLYLRNPSHVT